MAPGLRASGKAPPGRCSRCRVRCPPFHVNSPPGHPRRGALQCQPGQHAPAARRRRADCPSRPLVPPNPPLPHHKALVRHSMPTGPSIHPCPSSKRAAEPSHSRSNPHAFASCALSPSPSQHHLRLAGGPRHPRGRPSMTTHFMSATSRSPQIIGKARICMEASPFYLSTSLPSLSRCSPCPGCPRGSPCCYIMTPFPMLVKQGRTGAQTAVLLVSTK